MYLHNRLKGISRNQIQKLIGLGGVSVNAKNAKPSLKLKSGDVVEVVVPPKPAVDLRPEPIAMDILYEDDDMVVVNKHANFIVHPARKYKSATMVNALAYHFENPGFNTPRVDERSATKRGLSDVGKQEQRPGVVHRLDMNTTASSSSPSKTPPTGSWPSSSKTAPTSSATSRWSTAARPNPAA